MFTVVLSSFVNALLSAAVSLVTFGYILSLVTTKAVSRGLSFFLATAVFLSVYALSGKQLKKRLSSFNGDKRFSQRMRTLYLCTDDEIGRLFSSLFNDLNICADITGRLVRFGDKAIYAALYPEPLSANELLLIIRKLDNISAVVSSSFSESAILIAKRKNIACIDGDSFGRFLEKKGLLPEPSLNAEKRTVAQTLRPFVYKKNGKKFLLYGAMLALFSRLTFYPVYYVVCATVFAVYGLIALFFGKTDETGKTEEDFEKLLS